MILYMIFIKKYDDFDKNKIGNNEDFSEEELISSESIAGISLVERLKPEFGEIIGFKSAKTGEFFDLHQLIQGPITLIPINKNHPDFLFFLRHDCEHVLAQAVLELFPHASLGIGANMDKGFGYDFNTNIPFTQEDLIKIKTKMIEILNRKLIIVRELWSIDDALTYYRQTDNEIKVQVLESLKNKGVLSVTMYKHCKVSKGNEFIDEDEFIDLCRGPHGVSLEDVPIAFELTRLSAAQWSGNKDLNIQRICGVLFHTQEELEEYLSKIEKAKEADHRNLAQKMDLFHIQEHSPGFPFWHPRGWASIKALKNYITSLLEQQNYLEVHTPGLIDSALWKKSGHWDKFRENMFCIECKDENKHKHKDKDEDKEYALKPMNCPGHVEIFKHGSVKSYKMLPIRISEFGEVYRKEPTGALQGLKRVRTFTQDDGHIFCTLEQVEQEVVMYCELFKRVYKEFGFAKYEVDLSTRPDTRIGEDETWDIAEEALAKGARSAGFTFNIDEKSGAFYGPKLDFHVWDSLDRKWQCSTVQLDFNLPVRLEAEYVDADGTRKHPVMIHRAVYGSIERFLALALENSQGWLPIWASAVQVVIVPLSPNAENKCLEWKLNVRNFIDNRRETLSYKIREHTIARVAKMLIVGDKDLANNQVTLKDLRTGIEEKLPLTELEKMLENMFALPL